MPKSKYQNLSNPMSVDTEVELLTHPTDVRVSFVGNSVLL